MEKQKSFTHIAGTFVIQADGAFLNGAGLGQGEDRTTTVPKTMPDGRNRVPYVSSQSWRRWLRNTLIEETGWPASEIRAIKFNAKGNTSKVTGEVDPVTFAEDDIFGYMRTGTDEDVSVDPDEDVAAETQKAAGARVKSVMRPSPLATSLLIAIRRAGRLGLDEGTVFPKNGTPIRYATEFYTANMQAVFCLDYSRLGVFRNIGDRIELAEEFIKPSLDKGLVKVVEDFKDKGRIYAMTDTNQRRVRTIALLKALAVLRGGAKQAQFGADIAPKVIVVAGLSCGNAIFNHLFVDDPDKGLEIQLDVLQEVIHDYSDRLMTPVFVGIRTGYLTNENALRDLAAKPESRIVVCTPREAMDQLANTLP